MAKSPILQVQQISKTFQSGSSLLNVLDNISFALHAGEACVLIGPSGSGKTTLLSIMAGLERPTSGDITIGGAMLNTLSEYELARLRNDTLGFVFQTFQLIPTLTALENVMVPAQLRGDKDAARKASALLSQVGMAERSHHYPAQLSGGEQQRAAIARAFINEPRLLFADEPTGNLDRATGTRIIELLFEMNRDRETTLIVATHDRDLSERATRTIELKGGKIAFDTKGAHV